MYIGKRKGQVKKSADEYVYRDKRNWGKSANWCAYTEKNGLDKKSANYYVYIGKRKE